MKRYFSWLLPLLLLANSCLASPIVKPPTAGAASIVSTADVKLQVLGHISGTAMSIALWEHYALLGFSFELAVLDLADLAHPQWLTALPLPANDIVLRANYAYVAGRTGFTIVDIHDPRQPVIVSALPLPETPMYLAVTTDYAYITGYSDLYTIALHEWTQPALVRITSVATWITGVAAVADDVYVASDAGLAWLVMTDPARPVIHWLLANERLRYGPLIVDGQLYFGHHAMLWIKDLASSTPLRSLTLGTTADWIGDVAIMNGIAYMAGGIQGLHVWNLRDPMMAISIGHYPLSGLTKAVVAQDGYVYTLDCDEGLRIFDATNPHELVTRSVFTPLGLSHSLAVSGVFAYVAGGFGGGLHQVALTDPDQVHTITTHLLRNEVSNLVTADHYLYLTNGDGVGVIDLAIAPTPRVVAYYLLPGAWGIMVAETALYVSDVAGNVWVLDRTDPVHLTLLASYPELGYAKAMTVAEGIAYLAHQDAGMRLLAVGSAGELTPVGVYPVPTRIQKIVVAGHYAYLAVGEQGVYVVDVSDPTAPRLVSRYDTPGEARDLAIQWPYLLLADGDGGLWVFDMTQPPHLTAVAHYATADCIYQVVSANGLIYVAQPLAGLTILRLTPPPSAPKEAP